MLALLNLIKRNMYLYLRNKSTVFFSMLSMLIIIGLYALFMADVQVDSLVDKYENRDAIEWMINSWIMGGIIAVNAVNVTMIVLMTMVEDKDRGKSKDLLVAPIKRWQIIGGYLGAAIILGVMLSIMSFMVAEMYIMLNGGEILPFISIMKVVLGIIVSVISIASFFLFVLLFVKSEKTASAISTIVGTLIGFVAGVYVPIGVMPEFVQSILRVLPINYCATMFKQIFVEEPNKLIFTKSKDLNEFNEMMGNVINFNGNEVTYSMYIVVLLITAFVFFLGALIKIKVSNK